MKPQDKFTVVDFWKKYPNDDVCLEVIFNARFGHLEACPKCAVVGAKFYRLKSRRCYSCSECRSHFYPLAGTIMEKTTVPLNLWFYAMYLFATNKNGVSTNNLQARLGVDYRTAWRIGHKIRSIMKDESKLSGTVELDETLVGGKKPGKRGWGAEGKTCVFGMLERGGNVRPQVVTDRKQKTLTPIIKENVLKGSLINTDEFKGYNNLKRIGYDHDKVVHSRYQWAKGLTHTNSIEGFWSNLKKSILGTHTQVRPCYLQNYLDEFAFRYNRRKTAQEPVFNELLGRL